jgi:hypothetical protein
MMLNFMVDPTPHKKRRARSLVMRLKPQGLPSFESPLGETLPWVSVDITLHETSSGSTHPGPPSPNVVDTVQYNLCKSHMLRRAFGRHQLKRGLAAGGLEEDGF